MIKAQAGPFGKDLKKDARIDEVRPQEKAEGGAKRISEGLMEDGEVSDSSHYSDKAADAGKRSQRAPEENLK